MARRLAERPARATLKRNGVPTHTVDLEACWQALIRCQIEDDQGRYDSHGSLAAAAGTSRATVSAFFLGGPISLVIGRRIIKALRLEFDQVAQALAIVSEGRVAPTTA